MLKNILDFVEIRTKLASVLPLFTGTLYGISLGYHFSLLKFLLFSISLLLIDMTTTGLNNYFDYRKAILKSGYHYDYHNPISAGKLSLYHSKLLLFAFATLAIILGLILAYMTHVVVLILGFLAFGVAFAYSMGPLPISRTPFGEIFSGFFMGVLIPMIAGFIYIPQSDLMTFKLEGEYFQIGLHLNIFAKFIILSLPLFFLISNIMLANNTCDISEDIQNLRTTLPVIIGERQSKRVFIGSFILAYASIIIGILCGIHSTLALVMFFSLPLTLPKLKKFIQKPSKKLTFVNAVKIFLIFSLFYNTFLLISLF